jgi:hypothetical protein
VLYGSLRQENKDLLSDVTPDGVETSSIGFLEGSKPYVELGYGVENILRFVRIDFVHRLTYLDYNPEVRVRKFGILVGIQFSL